MGLVALLLLSLSLQPTDTATAATCPIDFRFTLSLPWNSSCCMPSQAQTSNACCCEDLLRLLGIGLSLRLKQTGVFAFDDAHTSVSCLGSLQTVLTAAFSVPNTLVRSCFPPDVLDISNRSCAGIHTVNDWDRKLGSTAATLNASCSSNLAPNPVCSACTSAMMVVTTQLVHLDGNATRLNLCYSYTVVYTAALVGTDAPTDIDPVRCLFRLPLRNLTQEAASGSSNHRARLIWVSIAAAAAGAAVLVASATFLLIARTRRVRRREEENWQLDMGGTWYTIEELRTATGDFSESGLIGRGGFGEVYKGVLPDGSVVAVKKVIRAINAGGDRALANEVRIISKLRHRNLVPLRGCCCVAVEAGGGGGQWYLVYDFMPNGCLHDHLFRPENKGEPLTWAQRRSIILDVARGLCYLHHGVKPAIIHRDIKPNNVLLDEEMRAAVADFGLARQRDQSECQLATTSVAGTDGYLAPEYALYGHLTSKVDVYSFGVMVLEIMSGRRAVESLAMSGEEPVVVAEWAREMTLAGKAGDVLEEALVGGEEGMEEMERFVKVGSLCAHLRVGVRPSMADALKMLEGNMPVPAAQQLNWEMVGMDYLQIIC